MWIHIVLFVQRWIDVRAIVSRQDFIGKHRTRLTLSCYDRDVVIIHVRFCLLSMTDSYL
jgi:hypothetical protein